MIDVTLIRNISNYILKKTGKLYFRDIKSAGNNLIVTCPFHKDGQERKPSCGIRITEDAKTEIGTMRCFTCEKTTSLQECIAELLGDLYNEDEFEALFHLKSEIAKSYFMKTKKEDLFCLSKLNNKVDKSSYNKYSKLDEQAYSYLHGRKIDEKTIVKYNLGYDNVSKSILFPIKNEMGDILALGRRSIEEKVYKYPPDFKKPLYGIHELEHPIRYLWIAEGPFNVWSLSQYGKQAVGLLGTGTSEQHNQLLKIKCLRICIST